jgi:hypothetical protein
MGGAVDAGERAAAQVLGALTGERELAGVA